MRNKEALGEEVEVSAEIARGKAGLEYDPRKIFDEQVNQISWDKLQDGRKFVMQDVIKAIKNAKLEDRFAPNIEEADIHLGKGKNLVSLTTNDGSKFKYNVVSKLLERA